MDDKQDARGKTGEPPAENDIHMTEQELRLIDSIRQGKNPEALLELALREIISRLPPGQCELLYPADQVGADGKGR